MFFNNTKILCLLSIRIISIAICIADATSVLSLPSTSGPAVVAGHQDDHGRDCCAEQTAELQHIRARLCELSAQFGVELNAQVETQSHNIAAQVAQLEEGGLPLPVQIHSLIDQLLNTINLERNLAMSSSLLDQIRNVREETTQQQTQRLQQQSTAFAIACAVFHCVTTTILMLAFIVLFKSILYFTFFNNNRREPTL